MIKIISVIVKLLFLFDFVIVRCLLDNGTTVPYGGFPDSELYVWIYCYNVFPVMLMYICLYILGQNKSVCMFVCPTNTLCEASVPNVCDIITTLG